MKRNISWKTKILSVIVFIFSCSVSNVFSGNHKSPHDIIVNKTFSNLSLEIGDTVKVIFILSNHEPNSIRGFYYTEIVPSQFEVFTDSVILNGNLFSDYVYEIGMPDFIYSGALAYRWIIEIPGDNGFIEDHPINSHTGSVSIYYSLVCTSAVLLDTLNYCWIGKLQPNENEIFGYGDTTTFISDVPVELSLFSAKVSGKTVELTWSTATESNNYGFEIQRGYSNNNFNTIGFIKGVGTSTKPHYYSFIDREVTIGTYYYRLKQINIGGTFKYCSPIKVIVNFPIQFRLEQNYPNPFNSKTMIIYKLPKKMNVKLTVYDVLGKEINNLVNDVQQAGTQRVSWNGMDIEGNKVSTGLYFYKLEVEKSSSIKKMLYLQ